MEKSIIYIYKVTIFTLYIFNNCDIIIYKFQELKISKTLLALEEISLDEYFN